ncbi:MAG: phosphoglycerate dehydrogenase [Eubacteriales bacterium]
MKILITPTSFLSKENTAARKLIEAFADEVVYNPLKRPLNPEEILPLLEGVDGYIAGLDYITSDVVKHAPAVLKAISRYGAGVDRVDIDAAKKKGISVTNTPGINATAVCELAFGMMLSLARSIPELDSAVKHGEWPRKKGIELKGKTLGIIGFGAIGKKLAVRAKAFEMDVIAYDPYFDADFAQKEQIKQGNLDNIIADADFISLHVPLTDETKYLINAERIEQMKAGAFIINTARGGLIDEAAVAKAIESGKIGGVGLDAFDVEPVTDSPLMGVPQAIMTPHAGAHTSEAVSAMGMMAVQNLIEVLEKGSCKNMI